MKTPLLLLMLACCLAGCGHKESQRGVLNIDPATLSSFGEKIRLERGARLESFVGKRVELVGTVSEAGIPQIQGVDLWGMEQFRGKPLLVSGVLQRTVVSSNEHGSISTQDSGTDIFLAPVYRGTGTFYRLQWQVFGTVTRFYE